MPVHCSLEFPKVGQAEMRELDYQVMGNAFSIQNDLGRLCDELIYKNALKARLISSGLTVTNE